MDREGLCLAVVEEYEQLLKDDSRFSQEFLDDSLKDGKMTQEWYDKYVQMHERIPFQRIALDQFLLIPYPKEKSFFENLGKISIADLLHEYTNLVDYYTDRFVRALPEDWELEKYENRIRLSFARAGSRYVWRNGKSLCTEFTEVEKMEILGGATESEKINIALEN